MIGEILAGHPWWWPLAWQSTLCLATGLAGSFLLRRRAVRAHQVLLLALVAAVSIPALSQVVKRNQWGLLVAERAVATPQRQMVEAPIDFVIPDRPMAAEPVSVPFTAESSEILPPARSARLDWTRAILPAWLAVSSILLLRLAVQFLLGRRLARHSAVVEDPQILQMIAAAKDKVGVGAEVEVRASARARSPVIWCWGHRPTLLIPQDVHGDDDGLDWLSILCHELAHARRRDHLSGLFAEVMVCVLPWQPLLWWARQRLAALSEEACDDWVIACGQRASGYARTLLGLTPQGQAALVPGVVTSRRGLAGRVHRILEDGCGNPRAGGRWSLAAIALAGSIAVGVGFAQTRPARSPAEAKPAASREQLHKILDAMSYHDRAVLPIALHTEIDLYNLDAPTDSQHDQTYVFEQRLDGKRLDSLMNVYRLRDGQFRHDQVSRRVFTGDQSLYRQQQVGTRITSLGSKDEATKIMAYDYMWGCTLFGYLPGDERRVATLLQNADDVVLHDRREEVDGFACDVIEGKTDRGVYKLWIDPGHDYRIRRAIIDKGPDDLWYGKPVSTPPPEGTQDHPRISVHTEIANVHLEKIGDHFLPTVESETTTTRKTTGKEDHYRIVVKRSRIDLKPDFKKLGAFVMDGIPEGTAVFNSDPNDHTYAYEWHNDKAVSIAPNGGIVTGRIQFSGHQDLSTVLTGRRSFRAQFTPEGPGAKTYYGLTVTPGKDGAFYVKDVPAGKYRLKLELTDLAVKEVPSGGFMPRLKMFAEAAREFSIPESKDAAQKTVDLGVIEMTLPSTPETPGGTDAGKEENAPRGQTQEPDSPVQATTGAGAKPPVNEDLIQLRLIDADGRPVTGAKVAETVFVHELTVPGSDEKVRRVTWAPRRDPSDQDGRVVLATEAFSRLPHDKITVYALHEERGMGAVREIARGDIREMLSLVLKPVCRVRGLCDSPGLAALGMPLRSVNASVRYDISNPPVIDRTTTAPKHEFEFLLPAGTYGLSLSGSGRKESQEQTPAALQAGTEFKYFPITVPEGQPTLDLGAIDLRPTKWATLIGHPAPEIGPMKAWKNGPAVTLADLRGQVVWLRFGAGASLLAGSLQELVQLHQAWGGKGLTIILISNNVSFEELQENWSTQNREFPHGVREVPFRIALDGDREGTSPRRIGATRERYGIVGYPTDILIDPAGNVLGQPDVFRAKEAISQMLSARQGPPPSPR